MGLCELLTPFLRRSSANTPFNDDALCRRSHMGCFPSPDKAVSHDRCCGRGRGLMKIFSMLCVAGGFIITKADIFPAVAARGAGQIALVSLYSFLLILLSLPNDAQNITMPCLMFSKILPSFSTENIAVLCAFHNVKCSRSSTHLLNKCPSSQSH